MLAIFAVLACPARISARACGCEQGLRSDTHADHQSEHGKNNLVMVSHVSPINGSVEDIHLTTFHQAKIVAPPSFPGNNNPRKPMRKGFKPWKTTVSVGHECTLSIGTRVEAQ